MHRIPAVRESRPHVHQAGRVSGKSSRSLAVPAHRMATNDHALDEVFGALSDPTRRAVVMRLCEGEASVGELAKPFKMALPSLMKHLSILENSGLVVSGKTGRVRTCALRTEIFEIIDDWLAAQRKIWELRLDRQAIVRKRKSR